MERERAGSIDGSVDGSTVRVLTLQTFLMIQLLNLTHT